MRWRLLLSALLWGWGSVSGWSQSGGGVVLTRPEYQKIREALEASETALTGARADLERLRADLARLSSESDLLRSELTRLSSEYVRLEQSWSARVQEVTGQLETERSWRWIERIGWAAAVTAALVVWGLTR